MSQITRTLSEITATATKAARGSGCPWGLAEEAGMAARLLESYGLAGVAALADLLETPRVCGCTGQADGPRCGIAALAELADAPPDTDLELGPTAAPVLLLAACLTEGGAWRIDWPGGGVACDSTGATAYGARAPKVADQLTVRRGATDQQLVPPSWHSRALKPADWHRLDAFAQKTYVPETAESRAAGAGPDGAEAD